MIYVTDAAIGQERNGWANGTHHHTGIYGYFPLEITTRVPESDAWMLHKTIPLSAAPVVNERPQSLDVRPTKKPRTLTQGSQHSPMDEKVTTDNIQDYIARSAVWDALKGDRVKAPSPAQKLFIMRHGERLDFTIMNWIEACFDKETNVYFPLDLNMPSRLPKRVNPQIDWRFDSPTTIIGNQQAFLTGKMMLDVGINICFVYVSPSYRCIQTAHALLDGMSLLDKVKIRIDPGLFEWCGWYKKDLPVFCTYEQLTNFGYRIDQEYVPTMSVDQLMQCKTEIHAEFYKRNHAVSIEATKNNSELTYSFARNMSKFYSSFELNSCWANTETPMYEIFFSLFAAENVLIVGHASNIDTNSRLLIKKRALNEPEMTELMRSCITYSGLLQVERNEDDQWKVVQPSVYSVSHTKNVHFDWKAVANFDPDNSGPITRKETSI